MLVREEVIAGEREAVSDKKRQQKGKIDHDYINQKQNDLRCHLRGLNDACVCGFMMQPKSALQRVDIFL